jgi:hypothetical protein
MGGVVVRYSEVSRERTVSFFEVSEMVHVHAAVTWKKTFDALQNGLGVISQSQVVTREGGAITVRILWH